MRVICLGGLLLDQVAQVKRFADVDDEVFVSKLEFFPGGSAANIAVFLSRLGISTGFVGKVGKDSFGDFLLRDMKNEGVDISSVKRSELPTGTVFVAVNPEGERVMYAASSATNDLSREDIDIKYINSFDWLVLASLENVEILEYAATCFSGKICLSCGALTAERGLKKLTQLLEKTDIFISSRVELNKLTGKEDVKTGQEIISSYGPSIIVTTLGPQGSQALERGKIYRAESYKVKVIDTTGAGDAFTAGFLYSHIEGKTLQDALYFGNACAALCIQEKGARAGVKNIREVEDFLRGNNPK